VNTSSLTVDELGIVESVLVDFNLHRLPRLLSLQRHASRGDVINEYDMHFLTETMEKSRGSPKFAELHPEFRTIVAEIANLYEDITRKALENEKRM